MPRPSSWLFYFPHKRFLSAGTFDPLKFPEIAKLLAGRKTAILPFVAIRRAFLQGGTRHQFFPPPTPESHSAEVSWISRFALLCLPLQGPAPRPSAGHEDPPRENIAYVRIDTRRRERMCRGQTRWLQGLGPRVKTEGAGSSNASEFS